MSKPQSCKLPLLLKVKLTRQDVKEAKKLQALNQLKNRVLSILPGQSVKIKLNRGSFEVKMVRVIEEEQKAEVQHENGQIVLVKWSEFDFKPVVAPKVVENEYGKSAGVFS